MNKQPMDNDRSKFLASFSAANQKMIATSENAYQRFWNRFNRTVTKNYTEEDVKRIIHDGSLFEKQQLSRAMFDRDGIYRRIITFYSTLLLYFGILIPNPTNGQSLSNGHIKKRYSRAVDYVDNMHLPTLLEGFARKVLVDGYYYGIRVQSDKNSYAVLDLPTYYCQSRFKDVNGNDIIEFDLSYFDTIQDETMKKIVRAAYPEVIIAAYDAYNANRQNRWFIIPPEIGICFSLSDSGSPFFLDTILASMEYDDSKDTVKQRDIEEIRKLIIQKIPHLNDGTLLFEPDEVQEMHNGAVGMLRGNENVSVMTTYGDVDAIVSKTSTDSPTTTLKQMLQNIYQKAGVSSELFASTGSTTLASSVNADISLMMVLANKFSIFVTNTINDLFSNSNIKFAYHILPISEQNKRDFVDETYKLAQSGYSFLLPAIAYGFSQRELGNVKDLEMAILELDEKLVPLASAFTQSGTTGEGPGAPKKRQEDKAEQTIKNEKSADNRVSGGSD